MLLSRTIIGLGASAAGVPAALIVHVVSARLLGTTRFGDFAYALAWLGVGQMLASAGAQHTILRFGSQYYSSREHARWRRLLRWGVCRACVCGIGVGAIVAGVSAAMPGLTVDTRVACLAAAVGAPVVGLSLVLGGSVQGVHLAHIEALLRLVVRPCIFVAMLLLVGNSLDQPLTGAGAMTLHVLCYAPLALAFAALSLRATVESRVVVGTERERELREWRGMANDSIFAVFGNQLWQQGDKLVVGSMLAMSEAGVYAAAWRVAAVILIGVQSATAIIGPNVAEALGKGDRRSAYSVVDVATGVAVIWAGLATLFLIFWGDTALALFGAGFAAGRHVVTVLACMFLVAALFGPGNLVLAMGGHQKEVARITFACVGAAIIAACVLVPLFGLLGASLAFGAATIARGAMLASAASRLLGIELNIVSAIARKMRTLGAR